jgi:hypothetical protein
MIRILFGLILGLILGVLLARSFAKPPKHTWQYETVWLRTDGEPSIPRTSPISLDDLNKEGADGWEVVGTAPNTPPDSTRDVFVILKR